MSKQKVEQEVSRYTLAVPIEEYRKAKANAAMKGIHYHEYINEAIKEKNEREANK